MKYLYLLRISFFFFIFSLTLHQLAIFEISKNMTIRLSELFFLFLIFTFIFNFFNMKIKIYFSKLDLILFLFPVLSFLHIIIFKDMSSIVGLIISIYSFLIYFLFKTYLLNFGKKEILNFLILSAFIASLTSIIGWILIQFGIHNMLVLAYDYPIYIGEPGRSKALFETPNSLLIFLMFPTLILLQRWYNLKNLKNSLILIVVFLGCFFTFSKSNVLLASLVLFLVSNFFNINILRYFLRFLGFLFILIYLFFSHYLVLNKNSNNFEKYTTTWFVAEDYKSLIDYNNLVIIPSNYIETKKKNLELFKKKPLFGNGFNSYTNFSSKKVPHETGKPHSTYFGYLSEFGLIGFLVILLTFIYIFNINRSQKFKTNFLFLFSIYIIIEALNADLMTSRIIWIFFAYSEFISINTNKKYEAKKIYSFR